MGSKEIAALGLDAVAAIKDDMRPYGWDEDALDEFVTNLDRDGAPTAYMFRCTGCGALIGYSDFD